MKKKKKKKELKYMLMQKFQGIEKEKKKTQKMKGKKSKSSILKQAFTCAAPNVQQCTTPDIKCKTPNINDAMENGAAVMENMMGLNDERDEEAMEDLGNRHAQIRDWIIEFQVSFS